MNCYQMTTTTILLFAAGLLTGSDTELTKISAPQRALAKAMITTVIERGPIARATNLPASMVQLIAFLRGPLITGLADASDYTIESKTLLFNHDASVTLQTSWVDEQQNKNLHTELLTHDEAIACRNNDIEKTTILREIFGTRFIPDNSNIRASHSAEFNCLMVTQLNPKVTQLYSTCSDDIEPDKVFIGTDPIAPQTRAQASCCTLQ